MTRARASKIIGKVSVLSLASAMAFSPITAFAEEAAEEETGKNADIVVTGRSLSSPDLPSASPVYVLSGDELAHRRQGGLGETLEGLPGVHLDSFGGGASRPVIRGQTLPRIEILSDGANLFDVSSTSPDHAIATDPLLLDGIEVLRGPAATRFGGNAMNGAVNLIDSKVPKAMPEGGFSGSTEFRYGTGDQERTAVGRITAAVGPFFAVHAEGSIHHSNDYNVPKSFGSSELKDSYADNSSFSMGASWITSNGYLGIAYTRQENEYGLPGHSHEGAGCHSHPTFLHCGQGAPIMPGYDDSHTAYIHLRSSRFDVRGDYDDLLPGIAHTRLRLSHTDYRHDEMDGDILFSQYSNKVYDGRLELTHKPLFGFTGTFGIQYTHGTFGGLDFSKSYLFLKPVELVTEKTGVFLSERRSFGALDLEISARQDWYKTTSPYKIGYYIPPETLGTASPELLELLTYGMDTGHKLDWPDTKVRPFSAAIAGTWNINDDYSVAVQLSRSQRVPSVREIYTKDNNLATNSFEAGLIRSKELLREAYPNLPERYPNILETAKAIDVTFRKASGQTQFEVGVFHQNIDNYIYLMLLDEVRLPSETPFHYFAYRPAHVTFTGVDGQVSHQFTPSSKVTVFGDYVRSTLKFAEDRGLPRMPPGRLGARYEGRWGPFAADLEFIRTFEQDRVATYRTLAYRNNKPNYGRELIKEASTDGYSVLNATLSYRLKPGAEIYLRGTNLTNELAFSHTSFVKDQSPLRGRNIVFGMRYDFSGAGEADYLSQSFDFAQNEGRVDWTGVYAGAHVSRGSGREEGTATTLAGTTDAIAATESADKSFKRIFPGVQAGFNHQLNSGIVLGAEAELNFTGLTGFGGTQNALATEDLFAGTDALQATTRYRMSWSASLKGRVGYAVDRWLPYVAGGIALARDSQKRTQYYSDHDEEREFGSITFPGNGETVAKTRPGFTVGGGLEYAVSSRVSVKAEYAYNHFSKKSFEFANARSGVGRDYYVWEMVEGEDYEDNVLHYGSSSTINGRKASNSLELHTISFGVNFRL